MNSLFSSLRQIGILCGVMNCGQSSLWGGRRRTGGQASEGRGAHRGRFTLGVVLAAVLLLAANASAQLAGQAVRGFTLPEYDDEGRLKQELYGETATLLEGGLMQLAGLRIEFYDKGELTARVFAPECALDQVGKKAASRSHIRIITDKGVLTGDGFAWNGENEQFQIFQNVRVVIDASDPGIAAQLGAPAEAATPDAPDDDAPPATSAPTTLGSRP